VETKESLILSLGLLSGRLLNLNQKELNNCFRDPSSPFMAGYSVLVVRNVIKLKTISDFPRPYQIEY
jgi:hypothetical protein